LKIAGWAAFFTVFSAYQPSQPKLQHIPTTQGGASSGQTWLARRALAVRQEKPHQRFLQKAYPDTELQVEVSARHNREVEAQAIPRAIEA
jgi:hypothetical protein